MGLPVRCPSLTITPDVPNGSLRIACREPRMRFVPLVHGARATVGFYDCPSMRLSETIRARVTAVFHGDQEELYRIREESSRGVPTDWYYRLANGRMVLKALDYDPDGDREELRHCYDGPEQVTIFPGLNWAGRAEFRRADAREWTFDLHHECWVDPQAYTVRIGDDRAFHCLRELQIGWQPDGRPESLNEIFIDGSGRQVLVQRYNGRWFAETVPDANWKALGDNPRLHLRGEEFRLRFVMVPAWVLPGSGEARRILEGAPQRTVRAVARFG